MARERDRGRGPDGRRSRPRSAHAVTFSAPTNFAVGDAPLSVAVGDFNGDSDPDLAVANDGSDNVSILLGAAAGASPGRPTSPPATVPASVAVGDFNGDSRPRPGGREQRLQQRLDPARRRRRELHRRRPTSPSAAAPSRSRSATSTATPTPTWRSRTSASTTSRSCSATAGGSFTGPTNFAVGTGPISVAVGDFNGDSRPRPGGREHRLRQRLDPARRRRRQLQRARPTSPSATTPISVAVGDFNGDSRPRPGGREQRLATTSRSCSATAGGSFAGADQLRGRHGPRLGRGR